MSLDQRVLQLEQQALEMGKYYLDGFGSTIAIIPILAGGYASKPEPAKERQAYELLQQIEDFYKSIPFDKLQGREEYYPLFIVRRLLPELRESMDWFFQTSHFSPLASLGRTVLAISRVGILYGRSFDELLLEIRKHAGAQDFTVPVKNYEGKTIQFPGHPTFLEGAG